MSLRQYYITDVETWKNNLWTFDPSIGSQWIHIIKYSTDQATVDKLWGTDQESWAKLPEVQAWQSSGGYILVSAAHNLELHADHWRGQQSVACLPHSIYESSLPICQCATDNVHAYKNFKQSHFNALAGVFGTTPSCTVWDLHNAVTKIHPGVRLSRPF